MTSMRHLLTLTIIMLLANGCTRDDDTADMVPSGIHIRLSNTSYFEFKNILVKSPSDCIEYDDIEAGHISDYKTFESAYRYAFIELEIHGQTLRIHPRDYVGATVLPHGYYTYELDYIGSENQYGGLSFSYKED